MKKYLFIYFIFSIFYITIAYSNNIISSKTVSIDEPFTSVPKIIEYYKFIVVQNGNTVCMNCIVKCKTTYKTEWTFNNFKTTKKLKFQKNSRLCITNVNFKQHMGLYTCNVKNKYGFSNSTTFLYPTFY